MIILIMLILLLGGASMLAVIDLFHFLFYRERSMGITTLRWVEILCVVVGPLIFLSAFDMGKINECCGDSAVFAPGHRLTIYMLILLCTAAYFYSSWRTRLASPLVELIVNCFLLIGVAVDIFIILQVNDPTLWLIGNISILSLFLTTILRNHHLLLNETTPIADQPKNFFERVTGAILRANFFIKFPILLILCLPLLLLLAALLFVFGQQPDSAIKAFTQTYKQGFSELDYMCDNVQCGGHYLCSVAANGHSQIVKPQRYGERNGGRIICNRQLLISNAFEELIEQKLPGLHRKIRKNYDRVGDLVHKHYDVFNDKFFSDCIYVLMKPFEWCFLITLYIADRKPEDRIAQQYLGREERLAIGRIVIQKI